MFVCYEQDTLMVTGSILAACLVVSESRRYSCPFNILIQESVLIVSAERVFEKVVK